MSSSAFAVQLSPSDSVFVCVGTMLFQCRPGPVHRLRFSFRRGALPPYIPLEHIACVGGCDTSLNEALEISLTPSTSSSLNNSTAGHLSYKLQSHKHTHLGQLVCVCCGLLILWDGFCRLLFN